MTQEWIRELAEKYMWHKRAVYSRDQRDHRYVRGTMDGIQEAAMTLLDDDDYWYFHDELKRLEVQDLQQMLAERNATPIDLYRNGAWEAIGLLIDGGRIVDGPQRWYEPMDVAGSVLEAIGLAIRDGRDSVTVNGDRWQWLLPGESVEKLTEGGE